VAATGRTSAELTSTITTALGEYMKNPAVTVIVMETTPQTIYVMGEVNAPGPQAMKGEISILQALASAGGFKDFAKRSSIKVLRPGPTGNTTLEFNYKDAIKGEAKILMLKPGDTVIVP
jgi:polysaccharide export outer membrane protein